MCSRAESLVHGRPAAAPLVFLAGAARTRIVPTDLGGGAAGSDGKVPSQSGFSLRCGSSNSSGSPVTTREFFSRIEFRNQSNRCTADSTGSGGGRVKNISLIVITHDPACNAFPDAHY